MREEVKQEFTCKCGEKKGWIADGKVTETSCPECGRSYEGVYNEKTLQIDAVEVEVGDD